MRELRHQDGFAVLVRGAGLCVLLQRTLQPCCCRNLLKYCHFAVGLRSLSVCFSQNGWKADSSAACSVIISFWRGKGRAEHSPKEKLYFS